MSLCLRVENLSYRYGRDEVLRDIDIAIGPGVTALVGPNGAGKSTLIKCIAGVLATKHRIRLGDGIRLYESAALSRRMSYLPQALPARSALTVFEMVLVGLAGSLGLRVRESQIDVVMATLEYMGLSPLAARRFDQLSGGQQQMVSLAQALVKKPALLLLDEPLNSLDIRFQFEILNKIRETGTRENRITLVAIHDLNLAAKYADHVIALGSGRVYARGRPDEVFTEQALRELYGMQTEITVRENRTPHIRLLDIADRGGI